MAIQKHSHRGTGKIRLVYVKDETIGVEGEVALDGRGKIKSMFGKAEIYLDETDGRCAEDNDGTIPLEFDPVKQRFCYVVDEDGNTWTDWSYWQHEKYKTLLTFTGKTASTCS